MHQVADGVTLTDGRLEPAPDLSIFCNIVATFIFTEL